jgi:hypothetical protein
MTGGSSGWLYYKGKGGSWRPLTSHYFWDNNWGADIVCRDMGFGKGTTSKRRNHNNRENFDTATGYRRCHNGATNIM